MSDIKAGRYTTNREEILLSSATRTINTNSEDISNVAAKGGHIILDVSSISGSPNINLTIQGKDPASGNYYNILISTAIVSVDTYLFKIYPGLLDVSNQVVSDILPRHFRVKITHTDTQEITYSVSAALIS